MNLTTQQAVFVIAVFGVPLVLAYPLRWLDDWLAARHTKRGGR